MQERLRISNKDLEAINSLLLDPQNELVSALMALIERYGGVEEINRRAEDAGNLETLLGRSRHRKELDWLINVRDAGEFITIADYRKKVLGSMEMDFDHRYAVTLEISACQYFSFLIEEAKRSISKGELMPGRYIRVRRMKEQEEDGDLVSMCAAMKIIGATWCETLDTRGTDGSNVHIGGPETITGYFGGVGQPNHYALRWAEEFLYYYTHYGVRQVLNINPGTVLLGYMMHKLGVNIEFKISVFMGNDNPYSVLWTLMAARLLSRADGTTPLIGFNFSNSVNNETLELSSLIRKALHLEENVRFEHHILETWKSIVRQPYDRRAELIEIAGKVRNISAKHEGGEVAVEQKREHPSDILDYFMSKEDIIKQGLMPALLQNYMDKHEAINNTARALTRNGIPFVAAWNLHR